jgi:opacity protein-like surface antigen
MRSRKSLFLVVAVLLLVPAAAFANGGGWTIDARAGLGLPTGDFKNDFKSGLLIGVEASKMMSPQFALGVEGSYVKNDVTSDNQTLLDTTFGSGTEADSKLMHYGAHAKYMMSTKEGNKFTPYLVGGAGLYHVKAEVTPPGGPTADNSESKFGVRGGIGANIMVGPRWGLGVQGDYNDIFTSGSSTQYIGVSGGLHFMLQPGSAK